MLRGSRVRPWRCDVRMICNNHEDLCLRTLCAAHCIAISESVAVDILIFWLAGPAALPQAAGVAPPRANLWEKLASVRGGMSVPARSRIGLERDVRLCGKPVLTGRSHECVLVVFTGQEFSASRAEALRDQDRMSSLLAGRRRPLSG